MLSYGFMQKAFVVGILVSLIIPALGAIVVNKRNAMVGDALSHTSLAGVCLGLILGINPVVGAILICTFAAFMIEYFRKKFREGSDLGTAIIMSTGIGLAAVLTDFVPGGQKIESFLFGSIVAIKTSEVVIVALTALAILLTFLKLYTGLVYMVFSEEQARLAGVNVTLYNALFTLLLALSIAISSRTVGVLMISSLMVLPVAAAIKLSHSFKTTILCSSVLGVLYTVAGLCVSYYAGLKPGGTIVLIGVASLFVLTLFKRGRD